MGRRVYERYDKHGNYQGKTVSHDGGGGDNGCGAVIFLVIIYWIATSLFPGCR